MRINGSLALETIDDTENTTITIERVMIAVITGLAAPHFHTSGDRLILRW